jgi:hypothetical protein
MTALVGLLLGAEAPPREGIFSDMMKDTPSCLPQENSRLNGQQMARELF